MATTMDQVFGRSAPRTALIWNPGSAEANVRLADQLLQQGTQPGAARIRELAERSLRRQPLNPGAARLLGFHAAAAAGREARAAPLLRYAEAMSRRDLSTQLWLIESNVAQGNVAGALRHYDRALKTSLQGRTILFPILISATNDRAIWEPLSHLLAQRPQWWRPFVVQLAAQGEQPAALYAIARRTGIDRPTGGDPALLQAVEKRLVDLQAYGRAADLYHRANRIPADGRATLRNGGFEQDGGWDPFQWNLIDEPDLSAVRQPSPRRGGGNALFLTAANGRGGDVAVQLTMLSPGRHAVQAIVGGVTGDPFAYPHFVVLCARDGREILNAALPAAPENGIAWRAAFAVPADCTAQRIVLRARSSLAPSTTTPWIDDISLRPTAK